MGVEDIHVVEEQSALLRVAMLVARDTPLEPLFTAVAAECARVLGIDASGVMRYLGGERAVVAGVWVTPGQRYLPVNAELDFHRSDSALGRAQTTGHPSRFARYDSPRNELSQAMKHLGMRTSVAAPIVSNGVIWGALVATAPEEDALPPGCEQRLAPFAELVGQALANDHAKNELAASRTRLLEGSDEVRRRLERALHEGAHQHVVALALKLRVAIGRAAARQRRGRGPARPAGRRDGDQQRAVRARPRAASRRCSPSAGWPRRCRRWAPARSCRDAARAARPAL